jgi:hypothetical protein
MSIAASEDRNESRVIPPIRRRKLSMRMMVVISLGIALVAVGCGGGSSDTPTAPGAGEAAQPAEDKLELPIAAGGEGDALTPVVVSLVGGDTAAVRGSDGRYHVVYELLLTNASPGAASLEAVEVLDAADGTEVLRLEGEDMIEEQALRTLEPGHPAEDASLPPNETRVLLLTASFESEDDVPDALDHRIEGMAPGIGATEPSPFGYLAGTLDLSRRTPPVLSPPLEGEGWIAAAGCCGPDSNHRAGVFPVNGKLFAGQRFAIDWIRVDADGRVVSGDPSDVSNWVGYGAKVMAVADGVVVSSHDGLENQVPREFPDESTMTLEEIDGNHVVIAHGDGLYSFYAHLQPGSVEVEEGDVVQAGDRLGLLGNSGGSGGPHLHFHLMSGPSPSGSDGFPYVFDSFRLAGATDAKAFEAALLEGEVSLPSRAKLSPVEHEKELPLSYTIVDFPSG